MGREGNAGIAVKGNLKREFLSSLKKGLIWGASFSLFGSPFILPLNLQVKVPLISLLGLILLSILILKGGKEKG